MYDEILVATDGSEQSERILEHAIELASKLGATLHGLYVVDRSGIQTTSADMREALVEEFEETGERALDDVRSAAEADDVDVVTQMSEGRPFEEISDYANDNDLDLIVMGTHGRSGLQHILMGSVAEKVIRHADVPVHLIRYTEPV